MKNKFIIGGGKKPTLSRSNTEEALFSPKSRGLGAVGECRILPEAPVCRGANSSSVRAGIQHLLTQPSSSDPKRGLPHSPDPTFHKTQSKETAD